MKKEVKRNYLEINSLQDLKEGNKPSEDYSLSLIVPINFQLMSKIGSDLSLLELGQKLDQINGRKIFPFERR